MVIKRGARVKSWKRRYAILAQSGKLFYFKNKKARKPIRADGILVKGCFYRRATRAECPRQQSCIRIDVVVRVQTRRVREKSRAFFFAPASGVECQKWMINLFHAGCVFKGGCFGVDIRTFQIHTFPYGLIRIFKAMEDKLEHEICPHIFRRAGSKAKVTALVDLLEKRRATVSDIEACDLYTLADLLKHYFRSLPHAPLASIYTAVMASAKLDDDAAAVQGLKEAVTEDFALQYQLVYDFLEGLFRLFHRVAVTRTGSTSMTPDKLAENVAESLVRRSGFGPSHAPAAGLRNFGDKNAAEELILGRRAIALMIQHAGTVFPTADLPEDEAAPADEIITRVEQAADGGPAIVVQEVALSNDSGPRRRPPRRGSRWMLKVNFFTEEELKRQAQDAMLGIAHPRRAALAAAAEEESAPPPLKTPSAPRKKGVIVSSHQRGRRRPKKKTPVEDPEDADDVPPPPEDADGDATPPPPPPPEDEYDALQEEEIDSDVESDDDEDYDGLMDPPPPPPPEEDYEGEDVPAPPEADDGDMADMMAPPPPPAGARKARTAAKPVAAPTDLFASIRAGGFALRKVDRSQMKQPLSPKSLAKKKEQGGGSAMGGGGGGGMMAEMAAAVLRRKNRQQ